MYGYFGRTQMRGSKMWRRLGKCGVVVAAVCLLIPSGVQAASFTYEFTNEFSFAHPPEGPTPWLTVTFDDGGTAGSVDVSLVATNLTDQEYAFEWLFNAEDPTILSFSEPRKTGIFTTPTINIGSDTYMADGDGFFDIQILFDNSDGPDSRFGVAEALAYTITDGGLNTITADSFHVWSYEDGGRGQYITVAHVGGIGPSDELSGWVPEPGALSLLAIGGLALLRRRRK